MRNIRYFIVKILCAIAVALTFWFCDTYLVDAAVTESLPNKATITFDYTTSGGYSFTSDSIVSSPVSEGGPGYPFINKFTIQYVTQTNNGLPIASNSPACWVTKFSMNAPSDFRFNRNYTNINNWQAGNDDIYLRYIDFYEHEGLLFYNVYSETLYSQFSYPAERFIYKGNINPFETNYQYITSANWISTSLISCSAIEDIRESNNQNETNDKLDDLNTKQDELNETSKGILGKLGDLITGIPNWFSNLASSIGEFFVNLTSSIGEFFASLGENIANGFTGLFNGIKDLFMGEEVCEVQEVEKPVSVPVSVFISPSSYKQAFYIKAPNSTVGETGVVGNLSHMFGTDYIPFNKNAKYIYLKSSLATFPGYSFWDKDKKYLGDLSKPTNKAMSTTNDLGSFTYYSLDTGVSSFDLSKVAYITSSYNKYSIGTIPEAYLFIEPHDEMTIVEENVCKREGGLFGILGDFFKSVGDFFGKLFGFIEDDSVDVSDDYFTNFEDQDYGFSDIVKMPLALINNISSATCTPLSLPLPFVDKNVSLPCMYEVYTTYFGSFLTIYQTITFGIVAYWVCINLFKMVRNFKNPDSDEVEVFEL